MAVFQGSDIGVRQDYLKLKLKLNQKRSINRFDIRKKIEVDRKGDRSGGVGDIDVGGRD